MSDSSFNRIEKKYVISINQYNSLKAAVIANLNIDDNSSEGEYNVSNIYYDTIDSLIIKKSVSKPKFKEKLRLRAYGHVSDDKLLYMEIKKKVNGSVNKRRTKITKQEADYIIESHQLPNIKPYHNLQVLKEILYHITKYNVVPKLFVSYDREAYSTKNDVNLRITFDTNIITRRNYLDFKHGNFGDNLLDHNHKVLEIKSNNNLPLWLIESLNENKIYESGFSKYGAEFYNYLAKEYIQKGGAIKCGLNPYLKALR